MTHPAPPVNGPWRVLVLDRDPVDPKWILALVVDPGDVTPADPATCLPNAARSAHGCAPASAAPRPH
jgi:hypothetical protein